MYSDLAASLNEVKINPATRGLITAAYDAYLTNQLQISAGKTPEGATAYRPYYVAAKFLEQLRGQQSFKKADGAEFTGLATPIASLLGLQNSLDQSLGLIVPSGFEAIAPDAESTNGSSGGSVRRFSTGSRTTVTRP